MDANNTNQKTLAGVLVTLLVGSLFVTAITPTAQATHLGAGADVVFDVTRLGHKTTDNNVPAGSAYDGGLDTTDVTIFNGTPVLFDDVVVPTSPSNFKLRPTTGYDLRFTWIPLETIDGDWDPATHPHAAGNQVTGPDRFLVLRNLTSGDFVSPISTVDESSSFVGAFRNVSFLVTTQTFLGAGEYALWSCNANTPVDSTNCDNFVTSFVVYPREDVTVTITTNPATLTYTGQNTVFTVNTGIQTYLSSDAPGMLADTPRTDTGGNHLFLNQQTMGAGTWTIFAGHQASLVPQCIGGLIAAGGDAGSFDGVAGHASLVDGDGNCVTEGDETATGFDLNADGDATDTAVALGGSMPERMGNRTFTIAPQTLGLETVAGNAFVGFANEVEFRPLFPTTNEEILSTGFDDITPDEFNFSIRAPNNVLLVVNTTLSGDAWPIEDTDFGAADWNCMYLNAQPGDVGATLGDCATLEADLLVSDPNFDIEIPDVTVVSTATTGTLFVQFDNWVGGGYEFNLGLEVAGGASTPPEYVAAWSLSPATPAAVTLSASQSTVNVPRANDAAATANPLTPGTPTSAAVGTVMLTLTVSGQSQFEHPLCRIRTGATVDDPLEVTGGACINTAAGLIALADDVEAAHRSILDQADAEITETSCVLTDSVNNCFVNNITLRGDVLPGWAVLNYNPFDGTADLRFTPTRAGAVLVDVQWKGTTTTLTIPVTNGANVTADVNNMTVGVTTTLTANVRNAGGGAVENAQVYVFGYDVDADGTTDTASFDGTGNTFRAGSGASGAGAGGNYVFELRPAAVQDLVVYAEVCGVQNNALFCNATYTLVNVFPAGDVQVEISETEFMAALRTPVMVNITNGTTVLTESTANYQVYFLTPRQTRDLLANGSTALFASTVAPTVQTIDHTNADRAWMNVTLLQENDYHVYVCANPTGLAGANCDGATNDNRDSMPRVNSTAYKVEFSPTQIASSTDIESNRVVQLTITDRNGTLANGTLRIESGSQALVSTASPSSVLAASGGATVTNGRVNVTLSGAGTVGNLNWVFNPREPTGTQSSAEARLNGTLSVVAGNLTFTPRQVQILQSTLVNIQLTNFTNAGLPGRNIRLCSASLNSNWPSGGGDAPATLAGDDITNCPAVATTGADGGAGVVVTPTGLNPIHVYINNSYTGRTIPVIAGTLSVNLSPTAPEEGGSVNITVTQPGGAPSVGSAIVVTRNGTQLDTLTADASGRATLSNLQVGTYTVTATRTGYENGTATFSIAGDEPELCVLTLDDLTLPSQVSVGTEVSVSAVVNNDCEEDLDANAVLLVNNAQRDTRSISLGAGENETVEYNFTPTVAGQYAISIRLGNETVGPRNIQVGTPNATTTPPTTNVTASPPTVSPPTVSPPTTSPPTVSPPTTSPTPEDPTPTSPNVPGFEVVALLAALGVALLVLRRRS